MYIPIINQGSPSSLFNLISSEQWEDAKHRAHYFPKEAKAHTKICPNGADFNKLLPLHHACSLRPTAEFTEALLLSYPKAAQKRDSLYKRLPIHVACLYGASSEVIRVLLEAYKDGAREVMKDGQLPLHYACGSGASKEVILELLHANPEGVRRRDINGWLPIHLACLQNASVEIIKLLIESYPESVTIRTDRGNTPMQCLRSIQNNGGNKEEATMLLREYESKYGVQGLARNASWSGTISAKPLVSTKRSKSCVNFELF